MLYSQLLKPDETLNEQRYRQQLNKLKRAIAKKSPKFAIRHVAIIFHHDKNRHPIARPAKNYLENGWKVLPHPPYDLNLNRFDYN